MQKRVKFVLKQETNFEARIVTHNMIQKMSYPQSLLKSDPETDGHERHIPYIGMYKNLRCVMNTDVCQQGQCSNINHAWGVGQLTEAKANVPPISMLCV